MEIRIDQQANAAYIRLAAGKVHETRVVSGLNVDYSRAGKVLGIEILGLREYLGKHGSIKIPPKLLQDRAA